MTVMLMVLVIFIFSIIVSGMKIVPQGYEWTVESFGQFSCILKPGFHWIAPVVNRISHQVNMMEQSLNISSQDIATKDNVKVHVDGVVFFKVEDSYAASYQITDLHSSLLDLATTTIHSIIASMDFDELQKQRDIVKQKLFSAINEAAVSWGTKITRVEIKDIAQQHEFIDPDTYFVNSNDKK